MSEPTPAPAEPAYALPPTYPPGDEPGVDASRTASILSESEELPPAAVVTPQPIIDG